MESQVKKSGFKIVLFFLVVLCLFLTPTVYGANYGEGLYGAGNYGEGGTQTPSQQTTVSSSTSVSAPGCGLAYPGIPTTSLYAAVSNNPTSATLYFSDATGPLDHYILEYGNNPNNYVWGVQNMGGKGLLSYTINLLAPGTTYYFRIRAANGCAVGSASNSISVKTKSTIAINQIVAPSIEVTPSAPQPENQETEPVLGYNVNVHVTDQDKGPIANAEVTIHSDVKQANTDSSGAVRFSNIPAGEHKILITYNGYEGEQTVNLTGDEKEININIVIELKNVLLAPQVIVILVAMAVIIIVLVLALIRERRKIYTNRTL